MMDHQIPFFGVAREFAAHGHAIMERIEAVLSSGQVLQGGQIPELESRLAALAQRKYAVAAGSATDALYFALTASGVQPGDEVLVTDFSFIASASCIVRLGGVPVFVDVDDTYNIDLEKAALRVTPRTRAMIFVHLYGQMGDPAKVEAFAERHGLILIEDAAQAIGASAGGRPAGSLGKASCFSFDPTKPISAPGSGGALLTDDLDVASQVRRLRYHGSAEDKSFVLIGYNSQMPSLTAAVLDYKLDHAQEWLARRREIARYYIDRLSDLDLTMPIEQPDTTHIYHKFVMRSPRRDELRSFLIEHQVQAVVHYSRPLHRQPCFAQFECDDALYPRSLGFSQTVLSLPIHPFLSDAEIETVVSTIRSFMTGQAAPRAHTAATAAS